MITSVNNEHIKELAKLNQAKYRQEAKLFLAEGAHLVAEAKQKGLLVELITTNPKIEGTLVSEPVLKKLTNTLNPSEVVGVCKMTEPKPISKRILALDGVSDPTNLGTILRSARAFGFETVFAGFKTVDYYNDKVVRASQGAIFKLNLLKGDLLEFLKKLPKEYQIIGTDVRDGAEVHSIGDQKVVLILGNEAKGVRPEVSALVNQNIYIPMEDTESLNVSVAGAILMYEMNKKKPSF